MKLKYLFIICFLIFFIIIPYVEGITISTTSGIYIDTGLRVLASKFNGSTTDFLRKTDNQLGNLSNMILEITPYGKIVFNGIINLTEVHSNNVVDLNSNVNIMSNFVSINTNYFYNLKRSANITLYGLIFTNPMILKEGVNCEDECTLISYYNGVMVFKVTNFSSNYSTKEIPTESPNAPGDITGETSGGTVSDSATSVIEQDEDARKDVDFTISETLLDVELKPGDRVEKKLTIRNTGKKDLLFSIEINGSMNNMIVSDQTFSIRSGGIREILVFFYARNNETPNVNTGRILFNTVSLQKSVSYLVEILEKKPLFDIKSKLDRTKIKPKGKIVAEIDMTNMGDEEKVDVTLEYFIIDFSDIKIKLEEETLAISDSLKIRRAFELPEELIAGEYVFVAQLNYNNNSATSANRFNIVEPIRYSPEEIPIMLLIIIILLIIIAILLGRWHKKRHPFI